VGHIQITAEDHRLFFVQPGKIVPESFLPFQPMVQPR
jgi:hypothetical protein